jgi:hypothetical protein
LSRPRICSYFALIRIFYVFFILSLIYLPLSFADSQVATGKSTTGEEQQDNTNPNDQLSSPFIDLFGTHLYGWTGPEQVEELPTAELLKDKKVVGGIF